MIDVKRSEDVPASLAVATPAEAAYRADDVRRRLHADFHGKCYLCEKLIALSELQVDHRWPQAEPLFPELRHEWTNLFPACGQCNNRRAKPRTRAEWRVLISPGDDVESRLEQWLDPRMEPCFLAVDDTDLPAVNTAEELAQRIHRPAGAEDRDIRAADIRSAIKEHVLFVYRLYQQHQQADSSRARRRIEAELSHMLSRHAPYTALTRSLFTEFAHLFDE